MNSRPSTGRDKCGRTCLSDGDVGDAGHRTNDRGSGGSASTRISLSESKFPPSQKEERLDRMKPYELARERLWTVEILDKATTVLNV